MVCFHFPRKIEKKNALLIETSALPPPPPLACCCVSCKFVFCAQVGHLQQWAYGQPDSLVQHHELVGDRHVLDGARGDDHGPRPS